MVKKHGAKKVRGAYFTRRKASMKEIRGSRKVGLNQKNGEKKPKSGAKNKSIKSKPSSKKSVHYDTTMYKEDSMGGSLGKRPSTSLPRPRELIKTEGGRRSSSKRSGGRSSGRAVEVVEAEVEGHPMGYTGFKIEIRV